MAGQPGGIGERLLVQPLPVLPPNEKDVIDQLADRQEAAAGLNRGIDGRRIGDSTIGAISRAPRMRSGAALRFKMCREHKKDVIVMGG